MRPFLHYVPTGRSREKAASGDAAVIHRRVEITVDREVISLLHTPSAEVIGWCEGCGREVAMLNAEVAAMASGRTPREIYRWLEENKLHFEESATGAVRICSESLKTVARKELP